MKKSNFNNNKKYSQSFLFPIILNYLGLSLPENSEPIVQYVFGVIILSLIAILSFINVLAYLIIMYSMNHYNLEEKYPKLKRIINYYKNTTLLFVIIEFSLGLISLIILFILSLIGLKNMIIF